MVALIQTTTWLEAAVMEKSGWWRLVIMSKIKIKLKQAIFYYSTASGLYASLSLNLVHFSWPASWGWQRKISKNSRRNKRIGIILLLWWLLFFLYTANFKTAGERVYISSPCWPRETQSQNCWREYIYPPLAGADHETVYFRLSLRRDLRIDQLTRATTLKLVCVPWHLYYCSIIVSGSRLFASHYYGRTTHTPLAFLLSGRRYHNSEGLTAVQGSSRKQVLTPGGSHTPGWERSVTLASMKVIPSN